MPEPLARHRAVVAAVLATTVLLGIVPAGTVGAAAPPRLDRFMYAIAQVESGGRYDARNPRTGAYGKYQIMPSNWRAWSKTYLGNANAKPTPKNQERVARAKFGDLWTWLKDWRVVAHWWLTGSKDRNPAHWSPFSRRYVNNVMAIMTRDGGGDGSKPAPAPKTHAIQESNRQIAYTGRWSSARHPSYAGAAARYSTTRGATATLSFGGPSVAWIAPVGPTRGRAEVSIDGKVVRTVDLFASGFVARRTVFTTRLPSAGPHTLKIRVLGTPGRPNVSIDEFRVGP